MAFLQRCIGSTSSSTTATSGPPLLPYIAEAHALLGDCYERGLGGRTPDLHKAFQSYLFAATRGIVVAQFHTARCYYDGIGTSSMRRSPCRGSRRPRWPDTPMRSIVSPRCINLASRGCLR